MARPKIDDFKVTGNLVNDPENVVTPNGRDLVTFRLAENNRRFDQQAEKWVDSEPTYYDVAIPADSKRLGNLAQNVGESLRKGNRVSVEGAYSASAYVTKDGKAEVGHRIWAEDVSPSMRYATVGIHENPKATPRTSAETDHVAQWDTATPGAEMSQ